MIELSTACWHLARLIRAKKTQHGLDFVNRSSICLHLVACLLVWVWRLKWHVVSCLCTQPRCDDLIRNNVSMIELSTACWHLARLIRAKKTQHGLDFVNRSSICLHLVACLLVWVWRLKWHVVSCLCTQPRYDDLIRNNVSMIELSTACWHLARLIRAERGHMCRLSGTRCTDDPGWALLFPNGLPCCRIEVSPLLLCRRPLCKPLGHPSRHTSVGEEWVSVEEASCGTLCIWVETTKHIQNAVLQESHSLSKPPLCMDVSVCSSD